MTQSIRKSKRSIFVALLMLMFLGNVSYSQDDKKNASLSVQYTKITKQYSFLTVIAKYKSEKGFQPCGNLKITFYKVDTIGTIEPIKIGALKTHNDGKLKFIIPQKYIEQTTSYLVKLENDKSFEDNEETITVTNINLDASIEKLDSIYTIKAQLLSADNKPIADESLKVGIKRLFGNLGVGEDESYPTDENGAIEVPVEKGFTGINGKLNFQVVVYESDKYGTVITNVNANFGIPIVDKSSFNERTMWSPPTKTPLFLLIIPNVILVGIWSILTLLLFNLYKIYKSKN